MTCRELVECLAEYLAGEWGPHERARCEEHLAECADCVAYLKTYQETIRLGKAAWGYGEELPSDVPEDLVRAVLAARRHGL